MEQQEGQSAGDRISLITHLTIGTDPSNDIRISGRQHPHVLPFQAQISLVGTQIRLYDLSDGECVQVEGRPVRSTLLQPGQSFSLGTTGPRFCLRVTDVLPPSTVPPEDALGDETRFLVRRVKDGEASPLDLEELVETPERMARVIRQGELPVWVEDVLTETVNSRHYHRRIMVKLSLVFAGILSLVIIAFVIQTIRLGRGLKTQEALLSDIHVLEAQIDHSNESLQQREADVARLRKIEQKLLSQAGSTAENLQERDPLTREIQKALTEFGKPNYTVPLGFRNQVQAQIQPMLSGLGRTNIEKTFINKLSYQSLIERLLVQEGLPRAFIYLAMHESMLDPNALSSARARGIWQFVPSTARDYGLRVPADWELLSPSADERTNPELSTRAAVRHIKRLIAELGDIPLAIVAYNAGQGKLRSVLAQLSDPIHQRDFWFVYRMGILSQEASEYLPKIVATMIVDQNRRQYGFNDDGTSISAPR